MASTRPIIPIASALRPSTSAAILVLHRDRITQEVHVDKAFPMLMRDAMSAAGADEMESEANLFA